MRTLELIIAFYLFVVGFAIIITWTLLLTGGAVPNIERDLFSLIFHWSSESFLAILSIAVGIGLLRYSEHARKVFFFVIGMAVCSTFTAGYYYSVVEPAVPPAVLLYILTFVSLGFLVVAFQSYRFSDMPRQMFFKFGLFNLGLFIYLALNVAGEYGQRGAWPYFIILIFLIIVGLSMLLRLLRGGGRSEILQVIRPE